MTQPNVHEIIHFTGIPPVQQQSAHLPYIHQSPDHQYRSPSFAAVRATEPTSFYSGDSSGAINGTVSPFMDYPFAHHSETTYAPCEGPKPWNYAHCYGYFGEPACQMMSVVDMEDFM